jgi:hypothetical protein
MYHEIQALQVKTNSNFTSASLFRMTIPHPSPRAYPSASLENVWHFPVGDAILADDKLMKVSGSKIKLTPPDIAIDISPEEKYAFSKNIRHIQYNYV